MITYTPASERSLTLFKTPFEQQLDPENRWVRMAAIIPWGDMAQVFFKHMSERHRRASIDLRIILGALLVKHIEGLSDEDIVQYIQENIYVQYFVGLPSFQTGPVFVPSLFVEVRKRLGKEGSKQLNDIVLRQAKRAKEIKHRKKTSRQARGKQLRYLRRNLKAIHKMLDRLAVQGLVPRWQHRDWQRLWVIQGLYRQQDIMHRDGRRRIDDRIVNIAQPYVRPIKRGKADKSTEFGAKLNMSETEGFVRADQISFDNFNEGSFLMSQIEAYKALYGYYPELVLADRIYLTRKNRKPLEAKGVRKSGLPLDRPPAMTRHEKQKRKKEQNKRSEIEGKFG